MNKQLHGTAGLRVEGIVELELVNKKDKTRRVYHNTITLGGKAWMLDKSAGVMLDIAADTFGGMYGQGTINKIGDGNSFPGKIANNKFEISNAILNLGSRQDGLTDQATTGNIYSDDMSIAEKVLAYANNEVTSQGSKGGVISSCKADYTKDPLCICKRWMYPEGVGSGLVDTIAMIPTSSITSPKGPGVSVSKLIDRVNMQSADYRSLSTSFLPPGVPGFTANDEILLNFNMNGISRWKYNITTGELSEVPETNNFALLPDPGTYSYVTDCIVLGNYLVVATTTSDNSSGENYIIRTYRTSDMTQANSKSIGTYAAGQPNYIKFLQLNGKLYVTLMYNDNFGTSPLDIYEVTINQSTGLITVSGRITDLASIGITIPSGLNGVNTAIGNYGSNYILYMNANLNGDNTFPGTNAWKFWGFPAVGYVFTDLNNIGGSIIGKECYLMPNEIVYTVNNQVYRMRIGYNYQTTQRADTFPNEADNTDAWAKIQNAASSFGYTKNVMKGGLFFAPAGYSTDLISFVKLATPIQKSDQDILYVSYGYRIV